MSRKRKIQALAKQCRIAIIQKDYKGGNKGLAQKTGHNPTEIQMALSAYRLTPKSLKILHDVRTFLDTI